MIHEITPDLTTTLKDIIANRCYKVSPDNIQNNEADTIASAYSVRPYHYPNVSAP